MLCQGPWGSLRVAGSLAPSWALGSGSVMLDADLGQPLAASLCES